MFQRLPSFAYLLALSLSLVASRPIFAQQLDELGELFEDSEAGEKGEEPAQDPSAAVDATDPFGSPDSADGSPADGGAEMTNEEQVQKFLADTKLLVDEGKYAEAIAEYSRVLAQNPGAYTLELERARCFVLLNEPDLALQSFQTAIDYGSADSAFAATAYGDRADVYLKQQRFEEALTDAEAALRANPTDPKVLFIRGKALARIGQLSGAQEGGDYVNRAILSLTRAIEGKEDYSEAYAERSLAYAALREFDLAVDDIARASELEPDNVTLIGRRGILFNGRAAYEKDRFDADVSQVMKDYRAAIEQFQLFLEKEAGKTREDYRSADRETITPPLAYQQLADARTNLASFLAGPSQREQLLAAIKECDEALVFDERSASALYQKGVALRMLGNLDEAIEAYTNSFELLPDQETLIRRGIAWFHRGDFARARQDFTQALEGANSFDGRVKFWIGATFAREGMFWDAIRYYSEAIRQNPEYKPAYNNRGLAYLQVDEYRRAANDFDQLVRRDRRDTVAIQRRDHAASMADAFDQ